MKNCHLSDLDLINFFQRKIIVHSYLYYHCNTNVISDKEYDSTGRMLSDWREQRPDLWQQSEYYDQFGDDYNGATGFDLFDKLNDHQKEIIRSIARYGGGK